MNRRQRFIHRFTTFIAHGLMLCLWLAPTAALAQSKPPLAASVTINATKVEGPISHALYGQFMEFMFEGVKGGVTAELIRNRSFEEAANAIGLSRYWERYPDDRDDDYAINFQWDAANSYPVKQGATSEPPEHALRVDVDRGVVESHGVYQSRIPVREGVTYRGYLWVKAETFGGNITVTLEPDVLGGERYAAAEINNVAGDWRQYEFTLKPMKSDPLARLAILINGKGRLWLDQVSLVPGDAAGGVRADVLARVKALRPAFVRWPGGNVAQDYHWQWGVGPRDQRKTWINLSWKNEPEPSDFGTDEFIQFCRNLGAEPSITVNVEGNGATAEEAAAWVEYCNGPAASKYGAMRARNGHPQPYGVKLWEVGNEIWGSWVRGHSDAKTYGQNFNRYAAAMRAVDPSIKLIAVGDNDMKWNRAVLKLAGSAMDVLAIHHYYGRREMAGDALNLMARPLFYERFYAQVADLIRQLAPGRDIRLAINEWGLDLAERQQYSMRSALYGARLMNVFERTNGLVAMSAVSDLVNGWPGGIIQAGRHAVFVSPLYHANALYANQLGSERLAATVESPTFDSSREGKGVPYLDAVISRSADARQIFIKAVNTHETRAINLKVSVGGAQVNGDAEAWTLSADSLDAANSFATPDAVAVRRSTIRAAQSFDVLLPEHSIAVITIQITQ
ncbi:MAG TPA: alpha-L-arabinofuranosidase C-terminal domain-containing protein [Blastocatellia bacterium]|nr:alpha-L-arabinofuranosidase C-terminal domain-containing protein [Blastocatellia bacterium]